MAGLTNLIEDVEGTIAQRSTAARERTLARITDLLVRDAERLGEEQIAVFDHVLGCVATSVPVTARADLAGRLADLANAPPNVTRTLAFDQDIVVAQAILSRSSQLSDQDLIEIAVMRGREHMTAICERRHVSELVTDVLVTQGDDQVWRAIAANAGAEFSPVGKAELLDRSREDENLQDILGAREDLTEQDVQNLVQIARDTAKTRLAAILDEPERMKEAAAPKKAAPARLDYVRAAATLRAVIEKRAIMETDVAAFARKNQAAEAITAASRLTLLPIPMLERVFRERDDDQLLVIGKANSWSWRTMRALLAMRDPVLPEPSARAVEEIEVAFDAISPPAARRALLVLEHGEAAGAGRGTRSGVKGDGR